MLVPPNRTCNTLASLKPDIYFQFHKSAERKHTSTCLTIRLLFHVRYMHACQSNAILIHVTQTLQVDSEEKIPRFLQHLHVQRVEKTE